MVLWSLLFSLVIYAFFSWHTGIKNIDNIRDVLLYPENLSEILGLGVLMGVALGIIGRIVRKWRAGGGRFVRGDVWETSMKVASNEGRWVIVHTKDGKEYKGVLHYSGGNGEPREMSIRKPELILRNDRLKVLSEIKMGKEILFQEKDIQRIVFFEEV